MKFNLLAGVTLLTIGNFLAPAQAQLITDSQCASLDNCLVDSVNKDKAMPASSLVSEVGQVSTIALMPPSKSNAAILRMEPVAQTTPDIAPRDGDGNRLFRATRSGSSYFGVGGNFGITGNSNLGGTSLALISKLGFSEFLSARPSILLLRDAATILIPVTYDFSPQRTLGNLDIAPYFGAGIAVNTGNDTRVGALLTTGLDVPLSTNFTVNVAANLAFLRTTDFGILVGVGYNF
jgi:hypothetical protein